MISHNIRETDKDHLFHYAPHTRLDENSKVSLRLSSVCLVSYAGFSLKNYFILIINFLCFEGPMAMGETSKCQTRCLHFSIAPVGHRASTPDKQPVRLTFFDEPDICVLGMWEVARENSLQHRGEHATSTRRCLD